jgi:hypothetical protein
MLRARTATAPRLTFVTIAIRPSHRGGIWAYRMISGKTKEFFDRGRCHLEVELLRKRLLETDASFALHLERPLSHLLRGCGRIIYD